MKCEHCGKEIDDKDLLLVEGQIEFAKEINTFAAKMVVGASFDFVKKDLQKQIASLQDQLEYQSSMASLFARKLQEVWNMQDDIIDKINNNSEDNYITIESFVKKLQKIKNIIPAECDKWDKKKSTVYFFEYVSKLMEKGYQVLIKQDSTLKNYDYKLELYPEGVCYVFDFSSISDTDNEFIVLWEDLNE